jgi:hypothetical protein
MFSKRSRHVTLKPLVVWLAIALGAVATSVFICKQSLLAVLWSLYLTPMTLVLLRLAIFRLALTCSATTGSKAFQTRCSTMHGLKVWNAEWYWLNALVMRLVMTNSATLIRFVPILAHPIARVEWIWSNAPIVPMIMYALYAATCYAVVTQSSYYMLLELLSSTMQLLVMAVYWARPTLRLYEDSITVALGAASKDAEPTTIFSWIWMVTYQNVQHAAIMGAICDLLWATVPLCRTFHAGRQCYRDLLRQDLGRDKERTVSS